MVGYIEASPEELEEHKKKYVTDWGKHAISRISTDPKEAEQGLRGYTCPCCGLLYDFSNDKNAQKIFDKKQLGHIENCSQSFGDGYHERHVKKTEIKLLNDAEYQKAIQKPDAILICMSGENCYHFEDTIIDLCAECGCKIHYRPYNKNATKKICIDCANKRLEK